MGPPLIIWRCAGCIVQTTDVATPVELAAIKKNLQQANLKKIRIDQVAMHLEHAQDALFQTTWGLKLTNLTLITDSLTQVRAKGCAVPRKSQIKS